MKEAEYFLFLSHRLPAIMFNGLRIMIGGGVKSDDLEVYLNS